MNIRFDGQRALVTGAGKGIGREIARSLVEAGATVIAVSRGADDLASLRQEISCETIVCDLATAPAEAAKGAGRVDLLVNNAGISQPKSFLDVTAKAFDRPIALNVRAALLVPQPAPP